MLKEQVLVLSLNKSVLLGTASLSYSANMGQKMPKQQLLSIIEFFPSSPKPTTSSTWQ
jgi:hypothetical protein